MYPDEQKKNSKKLPVLNTCACELSLSTCILDRYGMCGSGGTGASEWRKYIGILLVCAKVCFLLVFLLIVTLAHHHSLARDHTSATDPWEHVYGGVFYYDTCILDRFGMRGRIGIPGTNHRGHLILYHYLIPPYRRRTILAFDINTAVPTRRQVEHFIQAIHLNFVRIRR